MDRHKLCSPILSQHGCFQLHHTFKRHRCGRGCLVTFAQISKLASWGDHWTGHREHPNSRVLISTSGQPLGSQWELLLSPPGDQASLVFPVLAAWLQSPSALGEQGHDMNPCNLLSTHFVGYHPQNVLLPQQDILVLSLRGQLTSGRVLWISCLSFSMWNVHNNI